MNKDQSSSVQCRHCGASSYRGHGSTKGGKKRYFCKACARYFVEDAKDKVYDEARRAEILRAYDERASLRGVSRIFGVSRNMVTKWLKKNT